MGATGVTSDEKKGKFVSFDAMEIFIMNFKTGATVLYCPPTTPALGPGFFMNQNRMIK